MFVRYLNKVFGNKSRIPPDCILDIYVWLCVILITDTGLFFSVTYMYMHASLEFPSQHHGDLHIQFNVSAKFVLKVWWSGEKTKFLVFCFFVENVFKNIFTCFHFFLAYIMWYVTVMSDRGYYMFCWFNG